MVTSLHREIERSINIDIESSSRDDDVTVITNLSSVEASYTVVQGRETRSAAQTGRAVEKRAAHEFLNTCRGCGTKVDKCLPLVINTGQYKSINIYDIN